ncbi:hypothetical protein AB0C28_56065 [Nonomuraea sp. NPDC048892]
MDIALLSAAEMLASRACFKRSGDSPDMNAQNPKPDLRTVFARQAIKPET